MLERLRLAVRKWILKEEVCFAKIGHIEWNNTKTYIEQELPNRIRAVEAKMPKLENADTRLAEAENLARQAFDLCLGVIPDSGISAKKLGNLVVTSGVIVPEPTKQS